MAFQDPYNTLPGPRSGLESSRGTDPARTQDIPSAANIGAPNTSLTMPRNLDTSISADKSMQALFSGLADTGKEALGAVDSVIKKKISEDLYTGIDKIRDSFGVADATVQAQTGALDIGRAGAEGVTPVAINKLGNQVQGLTDAYRAGKLSDSYYSARLEAFVRDVREQYPGYRDVIDEKVSNIVGGTPANMLRKALLADVTELQKKYAATADKYTSFLTSKAEWLPKDFYDRARKGTPYSEFETRAYVAEQERAHKEIETDRLVLGRNKDLRGDVSEQAKVTAAKEFDTVVSKSISQGADAGGIGTLDRIDAMIKKAQTSGIPPTAQEQQLLQGELAAAENQARLNLIKRGHEPLGPGRSDSLYSSINNPDEFNKLIDGAMYRFTTAKEALGSKNFNVLGMNISASKAMEEEDGRRFIQNNRGFNSLEQIQKKLGPTLTNLAMTPSPDGTAAPLMSHVTQTIGNINLSESMLGTGGGLSKQFDRQTATPGGNSFQALRRLINDPIDILTNPKKQSELPTEVRANTAMNIFGDTGDFLTKFPRAQDRKNIFFDLYSPKMTASMETLRQEKPEVWGPYKEKAGKDFFRIFQNSADSIKEGIEIRKFIDVKYDPEAKEFKIVPTDEGKRKVMSYTNMTFPLNNTTSIINGLEKIYSTQVTKPVEDMNKAIKNLDAILKVDKQDINTALPTILQQMGVDLSAGKQNTVWGWVVDAANPKEKP